MNKDQISSSFKEVQSYICSKLESVDGQSHFATDEWIRKEGGGGLTKTLKDGRLIEKGGVAYSKVFGPVSSEMSAQLKLDGDSFFATGVSIVLHSKHLLHPIIHMNIRYFEIDENQYWFGGGIDLTPIYVNPTLATVFHKELKKICDRYDSSIYERFKKWADEYFYLPHRKESRGVGGIFFDHLSENESMSKQDIFDFCIGLAKSFPDIYAQQLQNTDMFNCTSIHDKWKQIRRSRYVEFNLLHDRGTKFGIFSNGRTESILMSMPPEAKWVYNYIPEQGTEEDETLVYLQEPHDWVNS